MTNCVRRRPSCTPLPRTMGFEPPQTGEPSASGPNWLLCVAFRNTKSAAIRFSNLLRSDSDPEDGSVHVIIHGGLGSFGVWHEADQVIDLWEKGRRTATRSSVITRVLSPLILPSRLCSLRVGGVGDWRVELGGEETERHRLRETSASCSLFGAAMPSTNYGEDIGRKGIGSPSTVRTVDRLIGRRVD